MTTRDLPSSTTVCRFMAIGIRNEHVAFPGHAVPAATGSPR